MILVTVGTNEAPFDRLLHSIAALASHEEELVVQHGPSPIRPAGAICYDYLEFDELVEFMRRARAVVSHAGVGSIMVCLANGRRPVVVPRRREFREAVDDHQLELGRRLERLGLVTLVENPQSGLVEALGPGGRNDATFSVGATRLAEAVGADLAEAVRRPRRSRRGAGARPAR